MEEKNHWITKIEIWLKRSEEKYLDKCSANLDYLYYRQRSQCWVITTLTGFLHRLPCVMDEKPLRLLTI